MNTEPPLEYGSFLIVVGALPAPENRYFSVFSIHRRPDAGAIGESELVHREGIKDGFICETAAEAKRDASVRAHEWIDSHTG
ncbi:hypothetical protein [Massilia timonae]|uniref:hypothetical protein n=1 Tax=Massilia timonae TaxID=47229 RepID=UPI0028D098FB|nr:hypothetical protein [Massilia timonae]